MDGHFGKLLPRRSPSARCTRCVAHLHAPAHRPARERAVSHAPPSYVQAPVRTRAARVCCDGVAAAVGAGAPAGRRRTHLVRGRAAAARAEGAGAGVARSGRRAPASRGGAAARHARRGGADAVGAAAPGRAARRVARRGRRRRPRAVGCALPRAARAAFLGLCVRMRATRRRLPDARATRPRPAGWEEAVLYANTTRLESGARAQASAAQTGTCLCVRRACALHAHTLTRLRRRNHASRPGVRGRGAGRRRAG
jgi:hypothetical protein